MIVRMKKVNILVQAKDAQLAVSRLRGLGVLHVEHAVQPKEKDTLAVKEGIAAVTEAVNILSARPAKAARRQLQDYKASARHIIDSHKRFTQLDEYARRVSNSISQWQAWGDFDPRSVHSLSEKGINVQLYQVPRDQLKNKLGTLCGGINAKNNTAPAGCPHQLVKVVSIIKGIANVVVISREKIDAPFKPLALPKTGLKDMRQRLSENAQIMKLIDRDLQAHTAYIGSFLEIRQSLEKELEFYQAVSGMGRVNEIAYITGYVPVDMSQALVAAARADKWAITISDPAEGDNVPTLIRNPKWVSIISPVFKVLEIVPGYKELDISLWFLVFLSVFFGILIGDAGYGLVFFFLTAFASVKFKDAPQTRPLFTLFYLLSLSAFIWGVLSGTFFGQEWLPEFVQPVLPALRSDSNVQAICFFIGAIHLSIAHAWRAITKAPSLVALADMGWVSILWGSFFLAKTLVLGEPFPEQCKWLFIIGTCAVILFSSPHRNILKAVAGGLGSFLLSFVNCFTDVVSYIRLFAVGLATIAVADSFNKMALSVGFGTVASGVITALILILGHTLNILLGPMSVLVHGVRLNVLEFCGHADVKWSGTEYKPLK